MRFCFRNQAEAGVRRQIRAIALVLTLLLAATGAQLCFAQSKGPARKLVTRVEPAYPLILRVKHIEGQVRLRAVVLPSGGVASIEVRGGNPILVENSLAAVKNWKYAPGPAQTDEEIVLEFSAR